MPSEAGWNYGSMVKITRLYLVSGGVPLSVTLKIKSVVSGVSTSGARMPSLPGSG